jgi:hypothetical protein
MTQIKEIFTVKKMEADTDQDAVHADRILLPVTAAIYQNGMEKPAMRWSFEIEVGALSDKDLHVFIERLKRGFGIANRCTELKIQKFKVSLSIKDFTSLPEFPKGRLFEVDCQEQWQPALKKIVNRERELIGKLRLLR